MGKIHGWMMVGSLVFLSSVAVNAAEKGKVPSAPAALSGSQEKALHSREEAYRHSLIGRPPKIVFTCPMCGGKYKQRADCPKCGMGMVLDRKEAKGKKEAFRCGGCNLDSAFPGKCPHCGKKLVRKK